MFTLGKASVDKLVGVHPILKDVVRLAITTSEQDFCVFEGIRSAAQAAENLKKGVSKTTHSLHLMQPDGYSHAVDLVPWYQGAPRWDWALIYPMAHAMIQAAVKLGHETQMVWGGVWDQRLSTLRLMSIDGLKQAVAEYQKRHPGPDFLDGPHFEVHVPA